MKTRFIAIALCMVMLMLPLATIGASATTTDGYTLDSNTKTFTVTTADGLVAVATKINTDGLMDHNVTLAADIDLTGKTWTAIGTSAEPYKGTFDGDNHTISNLTYIMEKNDTNLAKKGAYVSLIGKATETCVVRDLKITGFNLQGVEFVAAVIAETAQASTSNDDSDLPPAQTTIENVHIRETTIVGLNGDDNGMATGGGNRNSYTAGLIGKAGAYNTLINGCSIVATITGDCRVAGAVGGESVGSSVKNCGLVFSNTIVSGNYTQLGVSDGGAAAFLGYHSTIPATFTNCIGVPTLAVEKPSKGTAGVFSFMSNKLTMIAENCIVNGDMFGKISDVSVGTHSASNVFYYKNGETAATVKAYNGSATIPEGAKITLDNTETAWGGAMIPVINTVQAVAEKATAIYTGNPYISAAIIEEIVGHVHVYDQEVVDSAYIKTPANCSDPAVYYKSCVCGGHDVNATFNYGDPAGHIPSDKWTNDETNHWHVCGVCLEEKSDIGTHTYGDWAVTKEPTATRQGERAKTCTVCGHQITEKIDRLATTEAPTTADESTTTTEGETDKGGCGGTVLGAGTVALISLGAGALCLKKKKD